MINIDELLKEPVLEKIKSDVLGEYYIKLLNTSDLEKLMKSTIDDVIGENVLDESGKKAITGEQLEKLTGSLPFKHKKKIQDEILGANGVNTSIFDFEKK